MSVVALTVPLELSDAGALIPVAPGGGAGNGTVFAVDTAGYNSISIQVGGVWQASLTFQTSNDGVNWVNTQGFAFNSSVTSIDTVVDNDVYLVPVIGRYFQLVMSNYKEGAASITAYLRFQSIAGLGEAMMSQAMDQSNTTPINVTYQLTGQQAAAASVPVTLSNENIQDKFIVGRAFPQTTTYLGYNMLLDAADSSINPGAPIDCLQYRSIYFQFNSAGPAGGGNTVNATFLPEASNDLVNWTNVAVFNLAAAVSVGGSEVTSFNPANYGNFATLGANLSMRYFRIRCSSFGNSTFIQFTTMLRMTPFLNRVETFTNIGQQGASSLAGGTAQFNSGAQTVSVGLGASMSSALPPLIIGGTDRSIVKQEFIGAPVGATPTYGLNGPWARQAYFDTAGNMGVAGPQPFLAEDKTYPVNVRLERSINGQDSVQDLLQQILVELKLNNHYTRETPLAMNTGLFNSMEDELSDFVNDKTLYN
jgi:hypothetical protein